MSRSLAVVAIGALVTGCTFYTACPNGTGTPSGGASNGDAGGGAGMGNGVAGGGSVLEGNVPGGSWSDATGSLVGMKTGYGNIAWLSSKPDEDRLIAGISEIGLWESVDGAKTWQNMGMGKGSAVITNRTNAIIYDPDDTRTFWEAGTYADAIFQTRDNGQTFTQLGDIKNCEALSVDLADPKRNTLLASTHEMGRIVWLSQDGGTSWTDIGPLLPPDTSVCSYPTVIDDHTFLITCSQFNAPQHGIYRSVDAGKSWTQVSMISAYAAALRASDGAIYWSIEANSGVVKSTDDGQTWSNVFAHSSAAPPIELPDGSVAVATPDYVVVTSDGGKKWRPVTSKLPFSPATLAYSGYQNAFYISTTSTQDAIPKGVIQRYDFDYR